MGFYLINNYGLQSSNNSTSVVYASDGPAIPVNSTNLLLNTFNGLNVSSTGPVTLAAQVQNGAPYYVSCVMTPVTGSTFYTTAVSATFTAGSNVATISNTTNLYIGQAITQTTYVGSAGTFITSITPNTSITLSKPAIASGSGTIQVPVCAFQANLQYSTDNVNWTNLNFVPQTAIPNARATSNMYFPCLGFFTAPDVAGTMYIRMNVNFILNCTLNFYIDALIAGKQIQLPYVRVLTASTYSGMCMYPIDATSIGDVRFDVDTISGCTLTFYESADDNFANANLNSLLLFRYNFAQQNTITAAGYYLANKNQKYIMMTYGASTGTFNINGILGRYSSPETSVVVQPNITGINGKSLNQPAPHNNVTYFYQGSYLVGNIKNVPFNAGSITVSGNTGIAWQSDYSGLQVFFAIQNTAYTAGSNTGIAYFIDYTCDQIGLWETISNFDLFAAASIGQKLGPFNVIGSFRVRYLVLTASPTTNTVTILTQVQNAVHNQAFYFVDYGQTNPAVTYNVLSTGIQTVSTSTFALGTASSTTAIYKIDPARNLNMVLNISGGTPTTQPVVTLQLSLDGINFYNTSAVITAAGAGTYSASLSNTAARYARAIVTTASSGGTAYTYNSLKLYALE